MRIAVNGWGPTPAEQVKEIRQDLRTFYQTGRVSCIESFREEARVRNLGIGFGQDVHGHSRVGTGFPVIPMSEFEMMGGAHTKGCRRSVDRRRMVYVDPAVLDQLPSNVLRIGARSAVIRPGAPSEESEE